MDRACPESDWRLFRKIHQDSLQRYCSTVLEEIVHLCGDETKSPHDRYRRVFRTLRHHDSRLESAFDDPRRSRMILMLANLVSTRLVEPDQLQRFSEETRDAVRSLTRMSLPPG